MKAAPSARRAGPNQSSTERVSRKVIAPPPAGPVPSNFPRKTRQKPSNEVRRRHAIPARRPYFLRQTVAFLRRNPAEARPKGPRRGPKGQAPKTRRGEAQRAKPPKPAEARPKGPSPQNPPRRGPKGQARPGLDPPKPQPGQEARESTTQARPKGPSGRPSPGDSNVTSEARSSGGAGNRTRVREASRSPSFTCVVAVSPATGFPDSAETYLSLFLDHAIESTLARSSPVVTPYGYQDDLSGRRLSGS